MNERDPSAALPRPPVLSSSVQTMKISLLYPPDHFVPHSLYLSMPVLAGCLKEAGHEVAIRDLNAEVLDRLLRRETLALYGDYVRQTKAELDTRARLSPQEEVTRQLMQRCIDLPLETALEGWRAADTLRHPERFYDPAEYRLALDRLVAAMNFLLGSIVNLSPFLDDYLPQLARVLSSGQDDPVTRALDAGIVDSVLAFGPDLIGITMPFQEQIVEGLRIAARIRRARPGVKIAIGGPQVTKYEQQLFAGATLFDFIDFAVVGEGNAAIVELAEALQGQRALQDVRSLYWHRNGDVAYNGRGAATSMDALPPPSYDGANFDSHFKPEPLFGLMTSRGCAYNRCTFCSEAFHSNFAMRSPRRVFEDVKRLVERNGARHIFFWDSLLPPRTMWELADLIAAEGLEVFWFANTKFYDLFARPDQVKRLYDGGLRAVHFGMESANQRVLDLMRKGTRIDKVPAMLRTLHDGGILAQVSWFAGFPTETIEEHRDTVRFLEQHRNVIDLDVFVGSFYFEFGTYVAAHPEEFDSEIVDIGGDYALRCRSGMSPEEVERVKAHYMQATDMDLLCHGGYFLYHVNRGLRPRLISRHQGERRAQAL